MDSNITNPNDASQGVGQEANASASTLEAKDTATHDLIKNLKGEFNRKISKLSEQLQAALSNKGATTQQPVDETANVDVEIKQYVDTAFTHQKQVDAWQNALEMFPELNPESDKFDEGFYKAVDVEFSSNQRKDPKGPLKAAKLVALEMGKIEQLAQQKVLKDEARRSRILSEGSSTPREAKKEKDPASQFNTKGLARLGINADKLAKRIKDNKEKYEGL